jgi:hypothetical protein
MAVERPRAIQRNPVEGLLDNAADPNQPAEPTRPADQASPQVASRPTPTSERGKKQVNYRLDPALIDDLRTASIVHSFRKKEQYSQNRIVEEAVRVWLEANGPWD